jgi:hypothetical protein
VALWIEETDTPVWHRLRREAHGEYRAACGWRFTPWRGRLWPIKDDEPGPLEELRCRSCVETHAVGP